jgi:Mg-chelatase subunit ChlD
VAADGRLHACADLGDPFFRGAVTFGDPRAARPAGYRPTPLGLYERPPFGGPVYARRIDAGASVHLLQAPYQTYGPSAQANTYVDIDHDGEAVQRWTLDGQLVGQLVYHDQLLRDGATASGEYHIVDPLVDVAVDGDDTYMLANQVVWLRSDALPPDWYHHIPGTHLIAASADEGRVAVLNDAGRRVLVISRAGRVVYDRSFAKDWSDRLASDLALDGTQIYLADEGRSSVLVRGIDASDLGEWPTYAPPHRLAVGPDGDVFVLGRGGFGLRYSPRGQLKAYWRVPARQGLVKVEPTDLAVGDDGRVYVSYLGLAEPAANAQPPERRRGWDLTAGGIWVFEPYETEVAPLPPPEHPACTVDAAKDASPKTLTLGDVTTVTLRAEGDCPGHHEPQQLILVMDTSWSMHDLFYPDNPTPGALRRAQEVMSALLGAIDPKSVEIGLVTFSSGAHVDVPLPGALGDVRARVLTRRADGDSYLGAGVALAQQELRGPNGRPERKQTILAITDGLFHDDPKLALDAARADGIEVALLVMTTQGLDDAVRQRLNAIVGDPRFLFIDPLPETAATLVNRVSTWVPNAQLFERATVDDVLPDNMAYVPGSARPVASFDGATRTLRWDLAAVTAADGVSLTYQVRPLDPGLWPTNVRAQARYRDGTGADGEVTFPVPQVQVLRPTPTATSTPEPTATPTATATLTPIPTATPTATRPRPERYQAYLPMAVKPHNCIGKSVHTDVVLVLDASTSMNARTPSGRTKHEVDLSAARQFVALLKLEGDALGYDQVAVVAFNDRSWLPLGLTRDRTLLNHVLDSLEAEIREGTRLDLALDEAGRALQAPQRRPDNLAAVVLLTDGMPNMVPTPVPAGGQEVTVLAAARRVKDKGARIYTIGLGEPDEVWGWLMEQVASQPSFYHYTRDGADLAAIYTVVLGSILCGR